MTGNRSIFRFLMTLVFAALIASPQPMVASELSDNTGSEVSAEVTSTPSDDNTGDNPGDPDGDDTTESQAPEGEGSEGDGTTEVEGTEGEGAEGESSEPDATESEGVEGQGTEVEDTDVQGPEQIEIEIAPASDMQPLELEDKFWCNNNNRVGSAETWRNSAPEGADLDCFDISVITHECGILDMQFDNYLVGLTSNLYWTEGPAYVWNSRSTEYPITFPEDYNGGSVVVSVALSTPERGYVYGSGDDALTHWSDSTRNPNGTSGKQYVINTDCELPPEGFFCDYANHPGAGDVFSWLEGAPEGANTDCIDVGEIDYSVCGQVTIPLTEIVEPYDFSIEYVEGTDISVGTATVAEGGVIAFPEDYNGGSVTVTAYIGGPEQDWVPFANEGNWAYSAGGVEITIDTDCELPPEGFYCDLSNRPAGTGTGTWLASAPEGAITDCIDVGEIDYSVCGQVTIPLTETVEPLDYVIEYVEGTDISAGTAVVATGGVIAFPEDYNGGSVTVTAYIGGAEQDYVAFANEGQWAYAEGGMQITIDTDCIENIPDPGLPTPIDPAVCQVSHAGYTKMEKGPGVTDRIKVGGDEDGEINGDGWGNTMRLYAATRDDLTDVTLTWTVVGGGDFGAAYNTLQSPGAGALAGNGYDQAATGYTVVVSGNTITATVDSMPANSSISFNIPVTFAEGQTAMYVHSWMLGDLTDCEPAVLALPTITASVCDDAFQPTPIVVTEPEDSESVSYSDVTAVSGPEGLTFTITATVNDGFTLDGATIPDGWTVVNSGEATYSVTLALADCEVPLKVATPELPTLVAAMCDDDNEPVLPTLTVPETEGITYGEVTVGPANSVLLSLTATANEGYTFAGATLPEGWTLVSSSEAVYEIIAEEADCPTPEPTETPTPDPTTPEPTVPATPDPTETPKPEDPKKDPEVTELPTTGTGSNPASMIGLAATAAAAIAGAGIFFTNRKR